MSSAREALPKYGGFFSSTISFLEDGEICWSQAGSVEEAWARRRVAGSPRIGRCEFCTRDTPNIGSYAQIPLPRDPLPHVTREKPSVSCALDAQRFAFNLRSTRQEEAVRDDHRPAAMQFCFRWANNLSHLPFHCRSHEGVRESSLGTWFAGWSATQWVNNLARQWW